jgi:hypothetical protein
MDEAIERPCAAAAIVLTETERRLVLELREITKRKQSMAIIRRDGLAWQLYDARPVGRVAE